MSDAIHTDEKKLLAFVLSDLPADEYEEVARHLAACPDCRAAINPLMRAVEEVRDSPRAAAPVPILLELLEAQGRHSAASSAVDPAPGNRSSRRTLRKTPAFRRFARVVPAAAVIAVVFVAGFLSGRLNSLTALNSGGTVGASIRRPLPKAPQLAFQAVTPLAIPTFVTRPVSSGITVESPGRGLPDSL